LHGSRAGSVIFENGYEDPDPCQNLTDPEHWFKSHFIYAYLPVFEILLLNTGTVYYRTLRTGPYNIQSLVRLCWVL
jgi:hypothetical protein